MATLVSPGSSITLSDQTINIGAGPGTVPLIFIATQQDKTDSTGAIATGTTKGNAGKVFSVTSQRELVQTFGDPIFYQISGSSLNGYPLNEYGLLAGYSFLGVSNLGRFVRADIDTKQLESTPISPTSPAAVGTYWLDMSSSTEGSHFGLFTRSGVFPAEVWTPVTIDFVYTFATGTTNVPTPGDGVNGDYAVVFQTLLGNLSYWVKSGGSWVVVGAVGHTVVAQPVWPDLTNVSTTQAYWIKTSSPALGADLIIRKMDTLSNFVKIESPILANNTAADAYYSTGSAGQVYIKPVILGASASANSLQITMNVAGVWTLMSTVIGSSTVPVAGPVDGQLWFNAELGVDGSGLSTVDILVADGAGSWQNINLPGYTTMTVAPGAATLYAQSGDPRDNVPAPTLGVNDVWIDTDQSAYPVMYYWTGTAWSLIDLVDQTTPHGIIFRDARPNPLYHDATSTGENNGGGTAPDLDTDAPDADLYPKGFMLWNTRYSSNNVKVWRHPYIFENVVSSPDDTNFDSTGRWVNESGNDAAGKPYMGSAAQHKCIATAIQSVIMSSDEIRAEDMFFNLISSPGYIEAIDEMIQLNDDRKNTAFIVGDSPFTLQSSATALQCWATNSNMALGNSADGLITANKYFATWYPSGLSTNVDGTDVVVPPSHMALRTIAYNDQVAYPWFAPAGQQRGVVNNASSVGYVNTEGQFVPVKLNEGQRDILYQNGINPIRVMPQGGIVVFGQKTRQSYSSATDRINVVRLENYIRYQLGLISTPFLFEPNDSTTRNAVKNALDRFFSELITLRGLYDFLVVCDVSNNTPARIDRNELWVDIAIQPTKAIEYIYIPIRIKNTGSSLI